MKLAEDWLAEKETIRKVTGEVITDMLWHQAIKEVNTETKEHFLKFTRTYGGIQVSITHK